jgi:hypothetical protein
VSSVAAGGTFRISVPEYYQEVEEGHIAIAATDILGNTELFEVAVLTNSAVLA